MFIAVFVEMPALRWLPLLCPVNYMTVLAFASSIFDSFSVYALVVVYTNVLTAYRTEPMSQAVIFLKLTDRFERLCLQLVPSYLPHGYASVFIV